MQFFQTTKEHRMWLGITVMMISTEVHANLLPWWMSQRSAIPQSWWSHRGVVIPQLCSHRGAIYILHHCPHSACWRCNWCFWFFHDCGASEVQFHHHGARDRGATTKFAHLIKKIKKFHPWNVEHGMWSGFLPQLWSHKGAIPWLWSHRGATTNVKFVFLIKKM